MSELLFFVLGLVIGGLVIATLTLKHQNNRLNEFIKNEMEW